MDKAARLSSGVKSIRSSSESPVDQMVWFGGIGCVKSFFAWYVTWVRVIDWPDRFRLSVKYVNEPRLDTCNRWDSFIIYFNILVGAAEGHNPSIDELSESAKHLPVLASRQTKSANKSFRTMPPVPVVSRCPSGKIDIT